MTKFFQFTALALFLSSANLYAHHPAADIVDAEIYEMIDSMVADTPHATMTFDDDMGSGMTETSITAISLNELEAMIEDQYLLEYVQRLDGTVDVSMTFNDDYSVTMTVTQRP